MSISIVETSEARDAFSDAPPQMEAIERRWAQDLRKTNLLFEIARVINGPFHIINPPSFQENLSSFREVIRRHGIDGDVYWGKKANKASAWLHTLSKTDGAIDVASVPELVHGLANGIRGSRIGVTGSAKTQELLWLAARHRSLIAIDAIDELKRAIAIAEQAGPIRILLRVVSPINQNSRFGFNPADLKDALYLCGEVATQVQLEGFSFHLDGYEVEPRAAAANTLVDLCLAARARGLDVSTISIGGGFACSFVKEEVWSNFKARVSPDQFHAAKDFNHFYPYHQAPTGSSMLDAILERSVDGGSLASRLREHRIKLLLEPGRALLDGAGMSVFPVLGYKQNADYGITSVAGLSMSISEQWKNSEFLLNPILLQRNPDRLQRPVYTMIGGSSCMEYDVLTWRKVPFATAPQFGDLIIYPNSAGYQMDKNESEFHQLPLPPKIVVEGSDQLFNWMFDR